jgi:hypothetical protein
VVVGKVKTKRYGACGCKPVGRVSDDTGLLLCYIASKTVLLVLLAIHSLFSIVFEYITTASVLYWLSLDLDKSWKLGLFVVGLLVCMLDVASDLFPSDGIFNFGILFPFITHI